MELPAILLDTLVYRGQILHSDIFENIDHAKFFCRDRCFLRFDRRFLLHQFRNQPFHQQ